LLKSLLESPGNLLEVCLIKFVDTLMNELVNELVSELLNELVSELVSELVN